MSPRITPAPNPHLVPRQTYNSKDPYGLSSLFAQFSSLYPNAYSSYSYNSALVSSLLAQYSSQYGQYSIPQYSYPGLSAAATARPGTSNAVNNPTATAAASTNNNNNSGNGGLSTAAKIGIGVGVPLAVAFIIGICIFLWCAGKSSGKKKSTTVVQPASVAQVQQQAYAPNSQGYIQGYQQPMPPPQYGHAQGWGQNTAYGGAAKEPTPGAVELEQEYHFARPGVVEMGDGVPEPQPKPQKKRK